MVLDMKFFNVYYFCHLANNSMGNFEYSTNHALFVESHYEVEPEDFPKISVLRDYCYWLVDNVICEQVNIIAQEQNDYDFNPTDWVCQAILKYKKIAISYKKWVKEIYNGDSETDDFLEVFNNFVEYLNDENEDLYFDVVTDIAKEIEYILFQNREFLLRFNNILTPQFEDEPRCRKYIPEWVKRAVLFRDKGCCVFCKKDLTGLYTLLEDNQKHFDHIVPLENGGINDVCNIQLSCQDCNLKKSTNAETSTLYQSAY